MWRHPKYYKELRKRNKLAESRQPVVGGQQQSDPAISDEASTEATSVRPGRGQSGKLAAGQGIVGNQPSSKQQATSTSKQQAIEETVPHIDIQEAASDERQATSEGKLQATSSKRQASE